LKDIKEDFPFIDFEHCGEDDPTVPHFGIPGETCDSVVDRMYDFTSWLWTDMVASSSSCVGVASHSVSLFALTNGVLHFHEGAGEEATGIFGTGEMREFHLEREEN